MNKSEYLSAVRKQIHFVFDRDSIEKELKEHLEDSILDLMDEGYPKEEAEIQAVSQMGDPVEVGKQLNQEHHPILGYAWLASKAILILLLIFLLPFILSAGFRTIKTATPMVMENSVETIPLDLTLNLPTDYVKIDNICLDENGNYNLTYRSWTKFNYSRAGWSSEPFYLEGTDTEYLAGGSFQSNGLFGAYGYREFTWPEDDLLYVVSRDGKKTEINLKEYCDETK